MLKRKLKRYTWTYEDGFVFLLNNTSGHVFQLSMSSLDSFIRATITFKNAYRNEQIAKSKSRSKNIRKSK